jgi:hypothetical protein
VKRRVCLVATVMSAVPLAFGVAVATAAKTKHAKAKPLLVTCRTNVSITIAAGQTAVTPPVSAGGEYGSAVCNKLFGTGIQADHFVVSQSSGDTIGRFTWYFPTGVVKGTYDLTPQEGSILTGFASASYLGTITIKSATGPFKGYTGTATATCTSPDSIHTSCVDKLKLKAPKTATATAKK